VKKLVVMLCSLLLATPLLAFAGEPNGGKNLCLLDATKCDASAQSESIQVKEAKIKKELQKGAAVYTKGELQILEERLLEYQDMFSSITSS
jgi:hypothetical protein